MVARYEHLFAFDADARPLPARMEVRSGRIVLVVDDAAAEYPIVVDPLVVMEEGLLVPAGIAASDNLGWSVSISDNGSRAIVGAAETASGSLLNVGTAFIFVRSGITWTLEATLRRPGAEANDRFGSSVAISGDGTVALVGAPGVFAVGCDCEGGGVWAYTRTGSTWSAGTRFAVSGALPFGFGNSLALTRDGSRAVVGGSNFDTGTTRQLGEVYVFRRGPTWTQEARIAGVNSGDLLGASVAISADGTRAIAGMPGWDVPPSNSGGARVLVRSGTTWSIETTLLPSIATSSAFSGYAVALSEDGSRALVGSWQSDVGATNAGGVSVFLRSGTTWTEEATLLAAAPRAGASLGDSVSLSADGRRAFVGARSGAVGGIVSGTAHLFVRDDTTWTETAVFAPTGAASGDFFGSAIAISGDGRRGIVGARNDDAPLSDSGSARVFALGANDGVACTEDVDCGSGNCVDGVCCESACGGGVADCQACSNALTGMANGRCLPALLGTVCRVSAGRCDPAETCSGENTACPVDALHDVSEICRPSRHPVCDPEERCDGAVDCPEDLWASVDMACGTVPSGACDLPDHCEGTGPRCVEEYVEAGTTCNTEPVLGDCDTADVCTGDRPDCPPTFLVGVVCRGSTGGCDAPEICVGTADCPEDQFSPVGTVCRASSAACDPAESCDGVIAACPANTNTCPDFDAGPDPGGDAGGPAPAVGCACRTGHHGSLAAALSGVLPLALLALRRRKR